MEFEKARTEAILALRTRRHCRPRSDDSLENVTKDVLDERLLSLRQERDVGEVVPDQQQSLAQPSPMTTWRSTGGGT